MFLISCSFLQPSSNFVEELKRATTLRKKSVEVRLNKLLIKI